MTVKLKAGGVAVATSMTIDIPEIKEKNMWVKITSAVASVVAFSSSAPAADGSRALRQGNSGIASRYVDDVGTRQSELRAVG